MAKDLKGIEEIKMQLSCRQDIINIKTIQSQGLNIMTKNILENIRALLICVYFVYQKALILTFHTSLMTTL